MPWCWQIIFWDGGDRTSSNLAPPAGRGRIALAIRVRGYRSIDRTQFADGAPHPDPPRASFARLDPVKNGEREQEPLPPELTEKLRDM
jgi:hypothetical protein